MPKPPVTTPTDEPVVKDAQDAQDIQNLKELNVYARLSKARHWIHENKKEELVAEDKGAFNKILGLARLQPSACEAFDRFGLCFVTDFSENMFRAIVVNVDKPEERIEFTMPLLRAQVKSANEVQVWGATMAYYVRYGWYLTLQLAAAGADLDAAPEEPLPMHGLPREAITAPPMTISSITSTRVPTLAERATQLSNIPNHNLLDRYVASIPERERTPELGALIEKRRAEI